MLTKAIALIALTALLLATATESKRVMPWFCLERCDANSTEIAWELNEIQNNIEYFSAASFELYNLGPNGTLVNNNATLTPVAARLASMGLKTYPMISSYPYPPAFLDWMRQLWNPNANYGDAFINATIQNAILFGHTGYNVDWEPTGNATAADGVAYAGFLDKMARALHQYNIELTVDIASWSPIWNLTALNLTAVDRIITMDTYTAKWESFQSHLIKNVNYISLNKLGVGLSTLNLTNGSTVLPPDEMMNRFAMVIQYKIQEVDIWQMPIPDFWMPLLGQFLKRTADDEPVDNVAPALSLEGLKQLRGDLQILTQAQTATAPRRGHITRQKIAASLIE